MKSIHAIIKPHVAPKLVEMLKQLDGIEEWDLTDVKGFGRQKNYLNEYQGSEYSTAYIPKIMFKIRVDDESLETVLTKIIETTRTGRMGDGKIFVIDCENG